MKRSQLFAKTTIDETEQSIEKKRPEYANRRNKQILPQDNARRHIAEPVKIYIQNIELSDYQLF